MVNPESEILNPKSLNTPLSKEDVLNLKVGDMVLISGQIVTGRDKIHKFLVHERPDKKDIPFELHGGIIYHCGPIIKKIDEKYTLIAAGPTTSMRVEMYEAEVIKTYGIRGIIGKGGMGEKTLNAMKEQGCVYFHTISGAAAYLADRIKSVRDGWKIEEFGAPEAMWLLEAEDFPAIVTMDAHGNSLHRDIEKISLKRLKEIIG
ncbi:MAG: FumA C-terminus/TtdB family hydratase beta subunit [Nitrospirae bacterium]|nr:FumA C-terminus/TtdB family hydratase beta subunit [Nitrospirota bacterium]MDA8213963.1 FumA C-terminus/TtdB family hydratase beta subunit [Nitrospiraceae bacterium]